MSKLLVVVDMQNDFVDGSLGTKEATQIVGKVVSKIKDYHSSGNKVLFTKDTHDKNYMSTQEGRNLPVAHCIKGTRGWELTPEILKEFEIISENSIDEIVYEKGQFGSIDLARRIDEEWKEDNTLEVELVGLCTDICVLSNAMVIKSLSPELELIVDSNCCAGVSPESHHNALESMKMCQIKIV